MLLMVGQYNNGGGLRKQCRVVVVVVVVVVVDDVDVVDVNFRRVCELSSFVKKKLKRFLHFRIYQFIIRSIYCVARARHTK
jgi:hypothetical protein